MNPFLPDQIIQEINTIAKKYSIAKIVLFGSRARKDHKPTSDIDLAIYPLPEFCEEGRFVSDIEDMNTLLKVDLVFIDHETDKKLLDNIQKEGVVLYEQL